MKIILLLGIGFLVICNLSGQVVVPRHVCSLHDTIREGSGVVAFSNYEIWVHNDSGDQPVIYLHDTLSNILRTIRLIGVNHIDFEDITKDSEGNVYIGDFGNNYSLRQNLKIYKIPPPQEILSDSVEPAIISISYASQTVFPPAQSPSYDCEAMIHFNGQLFLFSKNRDSTEFTRLYQLPDTAGDYVLHEIDSFATGGWITAADISPNGSTLFLLSEDYAWLFYNFTGTDFFGGTSKMITLSKMQYEGCAFISNTELYLINDAETDSAGYVFYIDISQFLAIGEAVQSNLVTMYQQGDNLFVRCNFVDFDNRKPILNLYDTAGRKVNSIAITSSETDIVLNNFLSSGCYVCTIEMNNEVIYSKKIIITE